VGAFSVVPAFDPGEYRGARLFSTGEAPAVDELSLEGSEEAFNGRVVVAVSFPAQAARDPVFSKDRLVVAAGILAPAIAVQDVLVSGVRLESPNLSLLRLKSDLTRSGAAALPTARSSSGLLTTLA
jgi:hypothetical protein